MGCRLPVFDIKVKVQKRNAYTRTSQNELALQLFNMGFFNPQAASPALSCLEMMDFEGIDELRQRISGNGTLYERLQQMTQTAWMLVQKYEPQNMAMFSQMAQGIAASPLMGGGKAPKIDDRGESGVTEKARERANRTTEAER
jgi:hypothetical protein